MLEQSWFYNLILVVYAGTVFLYCIDFLHHNRKANQTAFWLLSIVWSLQTFYLIYNALRLQALPFFSQGDTLFFYSWLLISLSLIINGLFKMDFLLFFANLVGFTVLSFSLFATGREFSEGMEAQMTSEWVMIHVSIAFFSYAAFTLSFILALFYLFQHALLKKKKWGPRFRRLPNLMKLDVYQFRLNLVGLPLLVLSLILGAVWAFYTLETSVLADAKVVMSVLVTLTYAVYFYQRAVSGWSAKKMATLNACNFGFLLINYFVTANISDFHM